MSWALRNTLYASAFVIIPYIYVSLRLFYSAKFLFPQHTKKSRLIILLPVIWVNIFPLIMLFFYFKGSLLDELVYKDQTTLLDYFLLFPFWLGLIILLEILPYFLAGELIQLVVKLFFTHIKDTVRKWAAVIRIALLSFFILFASITTFLNTYSVTESVFEIKINDLPDELKDLNLALIADLQVDRFTQNYKTDAVKEIINSNKPDLLFFAGDMVTRGKEFIEQGVDIMCDLQANNERVACIGDHDFWADPQLVANGLQNCGWSFLSNANKIITYNNKNILVTGITYIYSQRITPAQLTDLMQSAPEADLKILLVHQPSKLVLEFAEDFGYDILLAGHTHGGQVVFSPFGYSLTPTKFENEFYNGYHKKNDLNIFITNGVGLTMMPLRYGAPAEVVKIQLKK